MSKIRLSSKVDQEVDLSLGIRFADTVSDILSEYIDYEETKDGEKVVLAKGKDLSEFLEKLDWLNEHYCDWTADAVSTYKLPKFVETYYPNIAKM